VQDTVTISVWGLVALFLLGCVVGYLFRYMLPLTRMGISIQKLDQNSSARPTFAFAKTVKSLSLRCQCGTTWRFHETGGHPDQGSEPMPEGDSFVCKNCGRSIDLREIRKAQSEALSLPGLK